MMCSYIDKSNVIFVDNNLKWTLHLCCRSWILSVEQKKRISLADPEGCDCEEKKNKGDFAFITEQSKLMGNSTLNEAEHPLIKSTLPQHQQRPNNTDSLIRRTCSESRNLWHIAAPSIFSRLAMFSITVVTQSFAGHLSDIDLAAISISCTLLISITFGFLVYNTPK